MALWPRTSWRRSAKYFTRRVMRLSASPHAVAAGVASGVAASFTPFIGFHFLLSFVIAFFVRGNMLAAALGTAVGNPLTFPFIWLATFEVGNRVLGVSGHGLDSGGIGQGLFHDSLANLWPILKPMLIGSVPLGLTAGLIFYGLVRWAFSAYQNGRRQRLAARRAGQGAPAE